jgi:pimeloyl-ACP methyl ester carboxylesterase
MNPVLNSKILGGGKPMLILHGFLGMLDNWKTLGAQYAGKGLQVHLIDQRNHGSSFWSPEFHYDAMTDDLHNYMKHHQLSDAVVLGHSMGGKTAMHFACTHPSMVEKLLVADIGPKYYPPHHQELLDALSSLPLEEISSRSEADKVLGHKIPDMGIRQFLLKNLYWKEKGKLAFRCNLQVLTEKSAEVGEALSPTAAFPGPALFIRGGKSDYVLASDMSEILGHFPRARLETIAGAGHWMHAEDPEHFFEVSMDFIRS